MPGITRLWDYRGKKENVSSPVTYSLGSKTYNVQKSRYNTGVMQKNEED